MRWATLMLAMALLIGTASVAAAVRFAQVPISSRFILLSEILEQFFNRHTVNLWQDRLPGGCTSFAIPQEPFGLLLLVRAGALSDRATVDIVFHPPDRPAFVEHAHNCPPCWGYCLLPFRPLRACLAFALGDRPRCPLRFAADPRQRLVPARLWHSTLQ